MAEEEAKLVVGRLKSLCEGKSERECLLFHMETAEKIKADPLAMELSEGISREVRED